MPNLLGAIGQAKPVSEFINTAGQYQTTQSNLESQRLQQKKMRMETDQAEKDNEELHPDAAVKLFPKEYQPYVLDAWKAGGALESNGMIKRVNARNTPKYIESHVKSAIGINNMRIDVLDKELNKLGDDPVGAARKIEIVKEISDLQSRIDTASGKEKSTVLVPKGTRGTITHGKYTPLDGGTDSIANVDLGTPLGTAESGAEVYHTTMGNVAVDPDTGERRPYSIQSDGNYSKKDEATPSKVKEFESVHTEWAGKSGTPGYTAAYEKFITLGPAMRVQAFANQPTNTPGVSFHRPSGKYYMDTANGRIELTSDQVKTMNLQYKEETPVNDIKVMQQTAPAVLGLSRSVRQTIEEQTKNMGPAASRWREFWAGKVGAPDPSWIKLRTNVGLLETRLMKMHVGASGGEYIIKHFKDLIAEGKRDPANMIAALDAIDVYATDTEQSHFGGAPTGGGAPAPAPKSGGKFKIISVK